MAFSFKNGKEIPQSYLENKKHFLNADLLTQFEAVQKDETQNIITLLKKYDISENEKSQLLELYEKLKGKVIYHDFWFANCGNCMNELPYYNNLIDQVDSNQVEFLFLGVFMEDEEWKKSIRERQLKGTHHLLTKNQLAFYEKYFEVYGFPHHQIVNSKSQIGDKSLFRAHPHNYHKITSLIQAHY